MSDEKTRKVEVEIGLDAEPEMVWKALTDASELSNWFPLQARVEPGVGGVLQLIWGEAFSGACRIEIWDPPRHLRTGWMEPPAGETGAPETRPGSSAALLRDDPQAASQVAVDYFIEGSQGHTTLRLVHSGFSSSPQWNDEYDGTARGWNYELRSLRHYLARHRGVRRQVAWARREIGVPAAEAWKRLMSRDGLLRSGRLDAPKEGQRYEIETARGDRLAGIVQVFRDGSDFAGTVEGMNNALFRLGIESCFGAPEAQIWVSTWGVPQAEVHAMEGRFADLLGELFPRKSPA